MKEFMLNEAFESSELGEIAAQDPAPVHEPEGACDLALFFENSPEGAAVFLVVIEALVDPVPVGLDEFAQRWRGAQVMFLTMQKEAEESSWFFGKDVIVFGEEASIRGREPVKFLDPRLSAEWNPGGQAKGPEDRSFNFCDLEDTGGMLVNVAGMEVIVPHECFDTAQLGLVPVSEGLGDHPLESESENVSGLFGVIVQAVACAMEEVEPFV